MRTNSLRLSTVLLLVAAGAGVAACGSSSKPAAVPEPTTARSAPSSTVAPVIDPITPIVLTFQRAIYNKVEPLGGDGKPVPILTHAPASWYLWQLLIVTVVSLVLGVIALTVFGRLEGNFAEEL